MMARAAIVVGFLALVCMANNALADQEKPYDFVEKPWLEVATQIPGFPAEGNLIEFYVGPTEHNRFFVDGSSINIGADGIVRYVLVLKTSGGASNVSLEGMRCDTHELKLFALGRSDGTWSKVLNPQWHSIENKLINQHHAVLSRDFLCPAGHAPRDGADARAALRRGKHPDAP
ncbi:MAG: CNP1-like family protein [Georgfuchsia sp.]